MKQDMTNPEKGPRREHRISRRAVLTGLLTASTAGTAGLIFQKLRKRKEQQARTFIAKAASYDVDLPSLIEAGMRQLGIGAQHIRGKRVLLKPNLLETPEGAAHIHTHPHVIRGAAEAMLKLGAERVFVGEGSAFYHEIGRLADESGLAELLAEDNIPIVDLNCDDLIVRANAGGMTRLKTLTFPAVTEKVDFVVSLPKMKTHHWAGVTLSMKNMFGLMPGIVYGWPKNTFHCAGIDRSILDINATLPSHLAIVDGITGMEGDGPLAGPAKHAGVIVIGRNLPAVDATAARVMGINPLKVPHLKAASGWLGTVRENNISQRGEMIASVQTQFSLLSKIPAQRGLRLRATRQDMNGSSR